MTLVSVVMPVYNARDGVVRAIDSVLAQTRPDLELVLVDDCSSDDSVEVIEAHLGTLSGVSRARVRLLRQPENGGAGAARNAGVRAARGDLVCFLDSDDVFAPEAIERLTIAMTEDVDLVVGSFAHVLADGTERADRPAAPGLHDGRTAARLVIADKISPFPWGKLFRRTLFSDVQFPEGIINEDYLANPVLAARSRKVRVIEDVVVLYHVRPDSITWGRVPDVAEVDVARAYLERELAGRAPEDAALHRAVGLADLFLTLTIGQRALVKEPRTTREDGIVTAARGRLSVPVALRALREAPRTAAAALLFKVAPPIYASVYRRWIAARY